MITQSWFYFFTPTLDGRADKIRPFSLLNLPDEVGDEGSYTRTSRPARAVFSKRDLNGGSGVVLDGVVDFGGEESKVI